MSKVSTQLPTHFTSQIQNTVEIKNMNLSKFSTRWLQKYYGISENAVQELIQFKLKDV